MGRIIIHQHITADGFVAGADGSLDWVDGSITDAEPIVEHTLAELDEADAVLLGRRTYEMFIAYWPTPAAADDPLAAPINAISRHVASTTLDAAPWGDFEPATLERGTAAEIADRLTSYYERDVIVWGSLSLASALLEAGRVDQLRLRVAPIAIGRGVPLWDARIDPARLTLVDATRLPTQQVLLTYDVG